jgi:hypothetical protein
VSRLLSPNSAFAAPSRLDIPFKTTALRIYFRRKLLACISDIANASIEPWTTSMCIRAISMTKSQPIGMKMYAIAYRRESHC